MMFAELMSQLTQKGIKLWVEDDNLCYQAPKGILTKQLREEILNNKPGIIDHLVRLKDQLCIHRLLEKQVEQVPHSTAVVVGDKILTYRELDLRGNRLSHYLREQGVGRNTRIGLCVRHAVDIIVGGIAILKAGGTCVPLNPGYPRCFNEKILKESKTSMLLTQSSLVEKLSGFTGKTIHMDQLPESGEPFDKPNPTPEATPDDIAFILFSAGHCIPILHRNITVRGIKWPQDELKPGPSERYLAKIGLSNDNSIRDLFLPLCSGSQLVVVEPEYFKNARELSSILIKQQINITGFTPGELRGFLNYYKGNPYPDLPALRLVFTYGEPLSESVGQEFFCHFSDTKCRLYSFYSLPAAGGEVALYEHKPNQGGADRKVFDHFNHDIRFHILDKYLNPVPAGIPGEIHITLSEHEYHCFENLDTYRWRIEKNPFLDDGDGYLLKTNDKCRWLNDGPVEYLGSLEPLSRVNDYRIDINLIEAVILEQLDVDDCVVTVKENHSGQRFILAYIVPSRSNSTGLIEEKLRELLPLHMVPAAYIFVSRIPRDSSGDIDLQSLSSLEILDTSIRQHWEKTLNDIPGIRQAVVLISKQSKNLPPLHLSDIVENWKRETASQNAATQKENAAKETGKPAADKPAICHGDPMEIGGDEPDTLAKVLLKTASCFPGNEIHYIHNDQTRTKQDYAGLLSEARQIVAGLRQTGIKPNHQVIFQFKNNWDFIPAFWACFLGGFVPIPIGVPREYKKENSTAAKLYNTWFNFDMPLVLTDKENQKNLQAFFDSFNADGLRVENIEGLRDHEPDTRIHEADPEDLALVLLTSGSTGMPKGVMQTHRSLIGRSKGTLRLNGFTASDISLNWMPLDHVGGIVMFHLRDVYAGCTQVQVPIEYVLQNPLRWMQWIDFFKATITWAPNFAFGLVNEHYKKPGQKTGWNLSTMRFILNGGEAIVPQTAREFLENLIPHGLPADCLHPAWGMSETCSGVVYSHRFSLENTSDNDAFVEIGKPIPGFSMRITDYRDQILKENETGHLQVKGLPVTLGFYKNETVSRESFTPDGWFKTGDLGMIKDGKLTITGRSKNEIIINGINYYSHEIESVVENLNSVETSYTAACAIRSPGVDTDRLALFFHTAVTGDLLENLLKEMREAVVHQVGIKPDYLVPLEKEAVPKTEIGKIRHNKLKEAFEAGAFDHILKEMDLLTKDHSIPNWFFNKKWVPKKIKTWHVNKRGENFLVFKDTLGLSEILTETLSQQKSCCITVEAGEKFNRLNPHHYCINPAEQEHYTLLIQSLTKDRQSIDQVLHLWSYSEYQGEIPGSDHLDRAQEKGMFSLLFLLQALNREQQNRQDLIKLSVISTNTHYIEPEDKVSDEKSPITGFLKTCSQEIQWLKSYHLDFAGVNPGKDAALVLKEIQGVHNDQLAAYREEKRLVPHLEKIAPGDKNKKILPFKNGGFYLISGGLGGIGKKISHYLLKNYQAKLLLVGKTPLPLENPGEPIPGKLKDYRELERLEGEVLYHAADVCDLEALQQGVKKSKDLWNQELDGILHLAGMFKECRLMEETRDNLAALLKPKMQGTWVLNRLLAAVPGRDAIFISFGSVNSFWGGAGVGGYSAANCFISAFMESQQLKNRHRYYSLSWSMWEEIGMSRGYKMKELTLAQGFHRLTGEQGIPSLLFALQNNTHHNLFIGLDGTNENILRFIHDKPYPLQKLTAYYTTADKIDRGKLSLELNRLETRNIFDQLSRCEFTEVTQMPLNPDGSIDGEQLRFGGPGKKATLDKPMEPRTEAERKILHIMKEILKSPKIGIFDDFFEVGGQSILAMKFLSHIKEAFEIQEDIPLKLLFEKPVVAELAKSIEDLVHKSDKLTFSRIPPVSRKNRLPLSSAQERMWFLFKMEPEIAVYNGPLALKLEGDLNIPGLEKSFNDIIKRHETLRTTFKEVDGQPYQDIARELIIDLALVDLSGLDGPEGEEAQSKVLKEDAQKPFDLYQGPLIRVKLIKRSSSTHILLLNWHHIITDGWSMGPLINELIVYYSFYVNQTPVSLPGLPIQYADFAVWQKKWFQSNVYEKQLDYWKKQLSGELPVLGLPTDKPRPVIHTYNGAKKSIMFPESLTLGIRELCRKHNVTMFMMLFAAFQTLLYRYSGQEDIIFGSPIANRNRKEIENLIGFFVNTLALRLDLSGNPLFTGLLHRTRTVVLDGFANQDLPFEKLVEEVQPERNLSTNPVFQVMFVLQNTQMPEFKLPGLHLEILETHSGTAKFDLVLALTDIGSRKDIGIENRIIGTLEYNTDLFSSSSIDRMLGCFERLLEGIAAHPEQKIALLPILSEADRQLQIEEWNNTRKDYPENLFLHRVYETQAQKKPDAAAAIFADEQITYRELDLRGNQLARCLRKLGVQAEVLVGICIKRSLNMITGFLGILKAGGSFLALDPSYPEERLSFMLNDSEVAVLLTEEKIARQFSLNSLLDIKINTAAPVKSEDKKQLNQLRREVLLLEKMSEELAEYSSANLDHIILPDNRMYVIYTSGSTGRPKGISMPHRVIANLLNWQSQGLTALETAKTLQFSSLNFDVSLQEMFSAWSTGSPLVLISEEVQQSAPDLLKVITRERVERIFMPSIILQHIAEIAENQEMYPTAVRDIITAGEQLDISASVKKFVKNLKDYSVHNHYGVSESHVVTALTLRGDVEQWPKYPTVGKPLYNVEIYILDPYLQPLPIGLPGEIHIGGVGLSRAFTNRPRLTAEKYIPNPFSKEKGARMYKSGDLGRYQADGKIEFLGRIDNQVKVRGFRIELGEIESVISEYLPVKESAVVVKTDRFAKQYLAAYVVVHPDRAFEKTELRELLKKKLPDYMLPSIIMVMDALPLAPSKKVDLRALPDPHQGIIVKEEYIPPRNSSEELLAGIWSEILGISRVGIKENFFELGGHSLLATQLTSRIRKIFQVEFPVRSIFEYPTLEEMAASINRLRQKKQDISYEPLIPQKIEETTGIPLSFAQERLWFIEQLIPGSTVYNMPGALGLKGSLDLDALEQSLNKIIARHESLRTTFIVVEEKPVQKIASSLKLSLTPIDISHIDESERENHANGLILKETRHHFDLSKGPLIRATLLQADKNEYILILNMHHIITDGWSMGIFIRELSLLYSALITDTVPTLPDIQLQYKDFAIWQRKWLAGDILEKQLSYWKKQIKNGGAPLDVPIDRPRPSVQTYNGKYEFFEISLSTLQQLEQFGRGKGVTLFMTLFALYQTLLFRYSGQEDIIIGTPVANRNWSEIEGLIGFFVNMLPLYADLSGNPTFNELLSRVREVTLEAYAHQDLPFEKLVEYLQLERNLGVNPLFQTVFALQNAPRSSLELPGVTLSPVKIEYDAAKFDFSLYMEASEQGLKGMFEYNTDLFDQPTIQRMATHFQVILNQIIINPGQEILDIPLLTEFEKNQVLEEWNNTKTNYPTHMTIHELFAGQMEKTPHKIAVFFEDKELSYKELGINTHQLAKVLAGKGVKPDTLIGIMVERSLEMIVGVLAILKAGGAYLPIDGADPEERIKYILDDSNVPVLLTDSRVLRNCSLNKKMPDEEILRGIPGIASVPGNQEQTSELGCEILLVDDLPAKASHLELESTVQPANLAYSLYTSGSTGQPKAVLVEHQNVVRLVKNINYITLTEKDNLLQMVPLGFDVSTFEIWGSLLNGLGLVLTDKNNILNPMSLKELIRKNDISTMWMTSSLFNRMLDSDHEIFVGLKNFLTGGEALSPSHINQLRSKFHELNIINGYGPTENTTFSTIYSIQGEYKGSIPIGKPIANSTVYILDKNYHAVPVGIPGELCVGGDGVSRGYLNNQELTGEKFISNPFVKGDILYKTGDVARWMSNSNIEFLGRRDHQVKIRGFRIELEEIEAQLLTHEKIKEAVVLLRENRQGENYLCAYVVSEGPLAGRQENIELKEYLSQRLPVYMVPSFFVQLDQIPLMGSSKIDRKALPEPEVTAGEDYVAPRNDTERKLVDIWSEVLNLEKDVIGIDANFFSLGGHSLKATILVNKIRKELNIEVLLTEIFTAPTIRDTASLIEAIQSRESISFRDKQEERVEIEL